MLALPLGIERKAASVGDTGAVAAQLHDYAFR